MVSIFKCLKSRVIIHLNNDDRPYFIVGLCFVILYPTYYFVWRYVNPVGYETFWLRIIATALNLPLVFWKYWPLFLRRFRPLYWFFTLLYSLPFLFTYLLFMNHFSYAAELNGLVILSLTVLLVDFLPLLFLLIVGGAGGFFLFYFTNPSYQLPESAKLVLVTYVSVIALGALFARKRVSILMEKTEAMKAVAAAIAHELRTPLRAIINYSQMKRLVSHLVETYEIAKAANLPIPHIRQQQLEGISEGLGDIEKEALYANNIIDMLLMNIRGLKQTTVDHKIYSLSQVVNAALSRYPFSSKEQAKLVHVDFSQDFEFLGDDRLVTQSMFNLINNALYYIAKARQGDIHILLKKMAEWNELYFEDTAEGIPKNVMPHIFDQFFTSRDSGTGIGLAYCRMAMQEMGGNIRCESKLNEYARFILKFPALKNENKHRLAN